MYARLRPNRSPSLLPIRMNAADTSASNATAACTPLAVVSRSRTTAEIDTFISEVSMTNTNIAIASSTPRRGVPDAGGALMPRSIPDGTAPADEVPPAPRHAGIASRDCEAQRRVDLRSAVARMAASPLSRRIAGCEAEGEGFEPSVDRKAHNGFRDRPVQPLRHPSAGALGARRTG